MEAKELLENVMKAIEEKQVEFKKATEQVSNLEKDIIFLSGQKSILESIQPVKDEKKDDVL
jgi:predicted  nucleic acid-binding Zn-ribbon protein